jgi:hypothetical protein
MGIGQRNRIPTDHSQLLLIRRHMAAEPSTTCHFGFSRQKV